MHDHAFDHRVVGVEARPVSVWLRPVRVVPPEVFALPLEVNLVVSCLTVNAVEVLADGGKVNVKLAF